MQPLVGAGPVVEVRSGYAGGGTEQAGHIAQVTMTREGGEPKKSINLKNHVGLFCLQNDLWTKMACPNMSIIQRFCSYNSLWVARLV